MKIFYRWPEFGKRILGKIVQKALLIHAAFKTGLHDQKFMGIDRFQMTEKAVEKAFVFHVLNYSAAFGDKPKNVI